MNIKSQFPLFSKHPHLVYLDSGATTLKPQVVIDKMMEYYTDYSANIHRGVYTISDRASSEYEAVRGIVKRLINASQEAEIVFTCGTTEAINLVSHGWGEQSLKKGDEVVITQMEHHANMVPWQMVCQKMGATLKYAKINDQFLISNDQWKNLINKKTKMVAITAVSNVLGTINDIEKITTIIKSINPKTLVLVDGAQAMAHEVVDVQNWGVDFLAFSGHKVYGPTGVGVLWGRKDLLDNMEPWRYGGGMIREVTWDKTEFRNSPDRFEGGTMPIAEVIGLGKALEWLSSIGWEEILDHEKMIVCYALDQLLAVEGLQVFGPQAREQRAGVFSMALNGVHPHDVSEILNRVDVCVRSGHHCAQPLHKKLGIEASFRASIGIYTSKEDIDCLVKGLAEVKKIFIR